MGTQPKLGASRGREATTVSRHELRSLEDGARHSPHPARALDQGHQLDTPLFPVLHPPSDRPASAQDR